MTVSRILIMTVAAVTTLCFAIPAPAQTESTPGGAAAESIEKFKDDIVHSDAPVNPSYEQGNLTEFGAKEILTDQNFAQAIAASEKGPVFVFKHSTECGISGGAYRRLGQWMKAHGDETPPVYLVKVIERKPVSQNIESRLKVKHESPQIILLDKKEVRWHTSHEEITGPAVEKALQKNKT